MNYDMKMAVVWWRQQNSQVQNIVCVTIKMVIMKLHQTNEPIQEVMIIYDSLKA